MRVSPTNQSGEDERKNVIPGIFKKGDHKNLRSTGSKTAINSTNASQSPRFEIFIEDPPPLPQKKMCEAEIFTQYIMKQHRFFK